ncbi:MAG: hypothetical protein AB7T49_13370 [Oligoflexales bacterium]
MRTCWSTLALGAAVTFATFSEAQTGGPGGRTPGTTGTTGTREETQAHEVRDSDISTVTFKQGSSEVPQSGQPSLRAAVNAMRADSRVDRIVVAVWPDKALPATEKDFSKRDQKLIDKRAESLKRALENLGAEDVETYTMAEHPEWAQEKANTGIAESIKSKGGPGKAVIIVKREMQAH